MAKGRGEKTIPLALLPLCSPAAFMNYATLLALLAALSFGLPLLVQLGEGAGVSRGSGIALTLAATLFSVIWLFLRHPLKKQAQQQEVQTNEQKND